MKEFKDDWMEDIVTSNRLSTSQKIAALDAVEKGI